MKKEDIKEKASGKGNKKFQHNQNKKDNWPYIKPTKCKNADKFQVTLEEIVTYVTKQCHHGQDIGKALETMVDYQIPTSKIATRVMDPNLEYKVKKQMVLKF
eukprot:7830745-Ditylum_brightwellii.AAC.1